MAISAESVAAWGRFDTPTGEELALLQSVIAAAVARLSRDYYIDDPITDDQETAIRLLVTRTWARRNTPEGRDAFGGEIAVSISSIDADVDAYLVPRAGFA